MTIAQFFKTPHGSKIAYHHHAGSTPTVVFFGGFMSDMEGTKATALEAHCKANGYGFMRFDYSGHGQSSGKFAEGTIGLWAKDANELIKATIKGDIIIIGSSMGGWTGLLAGLKLKKQLKAFIGIAAAPDFTERLMWVNYTEEQKKELKETGVISMPSDYSDEPYIISYELILDGRKNLLLEAPIKLDVPVRLIHGEKDMDVPCSTTLAISRQLTSADVEITLVKEGGHSLSEPADLKRLMGILDQLIAG